MTSILIIKRSLGRSWPEKLTPGSSKSPPVNSLAISRTNVPLQETGAFTLPLEGPVILRVFEQENNLSIQNESFTNEKSELLLNPKPKKKRGSRPVPSCFRGFLVVFTSQGKYVPRNLRDFNETS